MSTEEIVFNIISHAGDARSMCFEGLNFARKGDFKKADELIDKAKKELYEVHNIQTSLIQKEASGEGCDVSLLLVHAQDHLMTAMLAKDLIIELMRMYKLNYTRKKGESDE